MSERTFIINKFTDFFRYFVYLPQSTTFEMKKILITLFAALLAATALFAQTPQEIVAKMDEQMDRFADEGVFFVMEIKMPIVGTVATDIYILGDKYKMDADIKGNRVMHWTDGVSDWEYDASKKEIEITNAKPSDESQAEKNVKTLKSVTEGYDVKLVKETAESWFLRCTKSRTNTVKDDPKRMDMEISKETYLPISHKAGTGLVTVTMRNMRVGVTEEDVTFDPADFPGVRIVDKR